MVALRQTWNGVLVEATTVIAAKPASNNRQSFQHEYMTGITLDCNCNPSLCTLFSTADLLSDKWLLTGLLSGHTM